MKTKLTQTILATAAGAVLLLAPAMAHEESAKPAGSCPHHAKASKGIQHAVAVLEKVKTTTDATEKEKLLDLTRRQLAAVQVNMEECEKMCANMGDHAGHGAAQGGHQGHGAAQGSHQGHGNHQGTAAKAGTEVDPVCGMKVERNAELKSVYAGKAYYFCNKTDKAAFDKNPESYLKKKS